ncbi:hypothetical protein Ancab_038759 [Ancistrocladus abbreviatus]
MASSATSEAVEDIQQRHDPLEIENVTRDDSPKRRDIGKGKDLIDIDGSRSLENKTLKLGDLLAAESRASERENSLSCSGVYCHPSGPQGTYSGGMSLRSHSSSNSSQSFAFPM